MRAGKLGALKMMRSPALGERLLALQRLVFEDPTLERLPAPTAIPQDDRRDRGRARRSGRAPHGRRRSRTQGQRQDGRAARGVRARPQGRDAARIVGPGDAGDAAAARRSQRARGAAPQRDRARRAAAEIAERDRRSGNRDPRAAREAGLAVPAARHPLRSAGRREDDRRPPRARTREEARPRAVRRQRAVRRSERDDAALGSSGDDESAARQRPRPDLSRQPARPRRERDPRAEARPRDQGARRRAVHRRDRRDGARAADEAAQGPRRQARHLRIVVLRRARSERPGLREEALRRRRAGRFHLDRRDDARARGDRPRDPLPLRGGLLRAAHPDPDRAHRHRGGEASGCADHEERPGVDRHLHERGSQSGADPRRRLRPYALPARGDEVARRRDRTRRGRDRRRAGRPHHAPLRTAAAQEEGDRAGSRPGRLALRRLDHRDRSGGVPGARGAQGDGPLQRYRRFDVARLGLQRGLGRARVVRDRPERLRSARQRDRRRKHRRSVRRARVLSRAVLCDHAPAAPAGYRGDR